MTPPGGSNMTGSLPYGWRLAAEAARDCSPDKRRGTFDMASVAREYDQVAQVVSEPQHRHGRHCNRAERGEEQRA
jgi:hypothetical protein